MLLMFQVRYKVYNEPLKKFCYRAVFSIDPFPFFTAEEFNSSDSDDDIVNLSVGIINQEYGKNAEPLCTRQYKLIYTKMFLRDQDHDMHLC